MAMSIERPKLEGNVTVGDDRQLGFAEFGDPQGRAIFWLHGTPGARRQIPIEALQVEWAYRQVFLTNAERSNALAPWLEFYSTGRRHSAIGGLPPLSRLP